jgi:uncharacterized small protein (DUF1192 family)
VTRIALFEAEVVRLQATHQAFVRRRPVFDRSFLALVLAGFACFAFGGFAGLWGSISATVVAAAGSAMVRRRDAELAAEVRTLRQEIERMRAHERA